jgi:hypothetical protein
MRIWYKDPIYVIIHVLSGVLAYFIPVIIPLVVFYHGLQYMMDVRLFGFQGEIREGNSFEHTLVKLLEILAGYIIIGRIYTLSKL